MKLPRDVSGPDLARALAVFGYTITRQTGSRLTTQTGGEHHLTIPNHPPLRVGTLAGVLSAVADHAHTSREAIAQRLFGV